MRVHSVHHFVAIIHFVATSRFGFVFLNDSLVKNEGKSSRHRERERESGSLLTHSDGENIEDSTH